MDGEVPAVSIWMVIAYSFLWLGLVLIIVFIWRRQRGVNAKLDHLKRVLNGEHPLDAKLFIEEPSSKLEIIFLPGILLVAGVLFGVLLSQYSPIFGGIATAGAPWSPARQSLIGVHVFTGGGLGAGIGILIEWLKRGRR